MPETMSIERRKILQAYGAELVAHTPNSFMPGQFTNPANLAAHEATTAREIWEATGGTLSGVGEYLKDKNPAVKVIAVEPDSSPVLSTGKTGAHKIQGIGAGFVPDTLNTKIYDSVFRVTNEAAYSTAAQKNPGKTIVVLLPDTGERYLSTLNA